MGSENNQKCYRNTTTRTTSGNTKYLMPQNCVEKLNNIALAKCGGVVSDEVPVVMIHPIEGHVNMLRSLAKLLKFPVYCVQYTSEAISCRSLKDLAKFYWIKVQEQLGNNKQVHLCGLGMGAIIALEMMKLNKGKCASLTFIGQLFCLFLL